MLTQSSTVIGRFRLQQVSGIKKNNNNKQIRILLDNGNDGGVGFIRLEAEVINQTPPLAGYTNN